MKEDGANSGVGVLHKMHKVFLVFSHVESFGFSGLVLLYYGPHNTKSQLPHFPPQNI